MNALKLNQLNKVKVAEREMNAIKGGTDSNPDPISNGGNDKAGHCYGCNRAMTEYLDQYYCEWDSYNTHVGMYVL